MKRLSPSELALVCAPLVLAAPALFVIMQRIHPSRDPNAKIVLTVTRDPIRMNAPAPHMAFGWTATAKNSPQDGIEMRFFERVVASGHGNSQIVYSQPTLPSSPSTPWTVGVLEVTQLGDTYRISNGFRPTPTELPSWAEKAELLCDVVAVPRSSYTSGPASATTIQGLSTLRGATRIQKRFPLLVNSPELKLFQACLLEPVPEDFNREADTCVTIRFRDGAWRIFRQVVASDGKKQHVLWSEKTGDSSPYQAGKGTGINYSLRSESLLLKLKQVPPSWGKITFSVDAVFDPSVNAKRDVEWCDKATVDKFKSQGWIPFSHQLVVRSGAEM